MNQESILPRMSISNQDAIIGSILSLSNLNYIVALIGEPGSGKTVTVLDFCSKCPIQAFYYRCPDNLSMKSLLIQIDKCVDINVTDKDSSDTLQRLIESHLYTNPNYYFIFDEAENLCSGNAKKLDVIRQIWDATGIKIILVGTHELLDRITGIKRRNPFLTNHQSQIARRIRKEEFKVVQEREINDYLLNLELNYAVRFDSQVKAKLISICRDQRNGGLASFIQILSTLFELYRPEWVDISIQLNEKSNRTLHDFYPVQNFGMDRPAPVPKQAKPPIDISQLDIIEIQMNNLKQAINRRAQF